MRQMLFVAVSIFILAVAMPVLAARPDLPADGLQIKGSKKTVVFNHSTHKDVDCATGCHHKVKGEENFQKCSTSGCHDDLEAKEGEKSLRKVIHAKKDTKTPTCLSCHTKIAEEQPDKKKDLTGCKNSKCHP